MIWPFNAHNDCAPVPTCNHSTIVTSVTPIYTRDWTCRLSAPFMHDFVNHFMCVSSAATASYKPIGWVEARYITEHSFPLDLVVENMGPGTSPSLPYLHSNILSFNPQDLDGGNYEKFVKGDAVYVSAPCTFPLDHQNGPHSDKLMVHRGNRLSRQ